MLSFVIKHALWDTTISGVYHSFREKWCSSVFWPSYSQTVTLRPPRLYDRVVVTTTLGSLRSNDAKATRTSFKKVCLRSFNLYSNYSYPCSRCRRTLLKLNFKGPYPSSERELKFRRCLFTSSIKHEIRHFHVVVVQKRERNVQKKCDARAKLLFCL